MFISYFLVFLLAAIPLFELITVVPLAIIGGLSPVPVAILGFLGNTLTVILLVVFVDRVKRWLAVRKQNLVGVREQDGEEIQISEEVSVEQNSKKEKRARVLFDRYGLPGLTIIGPLLVGSHISAFMGMSFGSKRSLVMGWMLVSLILWTIVSAVAVSYGVTYFVPNVEEDGFLIRIFQ
jgi:Ca2+/H+ antiporter, TMEM165/GDT1 family